MVVTDLTRQLLCGNSNPIDLDDAGGGGGDIV